MGGQKLPFASEIGKQHRKHVDAIIEVIWRGVYKLYKTQSWRSDLSNKPPRLELIEIVGGVPMPKCFKWYQEEGQKVYKESIMSLQQDTLKLRASKLAGKLEKPKKVYYDLGI